VLEEGSTIWDGQGRRESGKKSHHCWVKSRLRKGMVIGINRDDYVRSGKGAKIIWGSRRGGGKKPELWGKKGGVAFLIGEGNSVIRLPVLVKIRKFREEGQSLMSSPGA